MLPVKQKRRSTLLLVRTPFQAWLANKVIEHTDPPSIDLVYFTYHDSAKDRYYFALLAKKSRRSIYVNVRRRKRDALHHGYLYFTKFFGRGFNGYQKVLLASFDSYLFRMLARRQKNAEFVTFDDGTANIYPQSSYHCYTPSRLSWLYDFLLRAGSREKFKKDINKHWTIYDKFENIVEGSRLELIHAWEDNGESVADDEEPVKFFIGQPFDEVVKAGGFFADDLSRLERLVSKLGIHYYLQHPREIHPLNIGATLIGDGEKIAEELIAELCIGKKAIVYGWFTTVLFNLPSDRVRKIYLSLGETTDEKLRMMMCEKVGCEILRVNSES
ncbi:glycosyltransferase family 52 [Halomonas sp.]|uniref:glycosyltransferase family 52 n=1 Tax=Halomonas sp. TaxID=1486246 RepID=UPI003563A614